MCGLSLLVPAVVSSQTTSAIEVAALYEPETRYSIYRKGKKIGEHSLNISTTESDVRVSVESQITVRVLKVPVFKFSYQSSELWENDQLTSVESVTVTNRKTEKASLENINGSSTLRNDTGTTKTDLLPFATNHWHIGAVEQTVLFNTVKGTAGRVQVEKIPNEKLQIDQKELSVTHYKYTGDIVAESWYDSNNRWVKLAFLGSDGSQITYLINNP